MDNSIFSLNENMLNAIIAAQVDKLVAIKLREFETQLSLNYIFDDSLLSREEVANKINVSLGTLDNMRDQKKIIGYSVGKLVKFKKSEVLQYIKNLSNPD